MENLPIQPKNTGYVVDDKSEFFNPTDGTFISKEDLKNLPAMDVMRTAAQTIGLKLKDPKKDCRKCYGRGYVGRDVKTNQPIACQCIFDKDEKKEATGGYMNHAAKRNMKLNIRRKIRKMSPTQIKQVIEKEMQNNPVEEVKNG